MASVTIDLPDSLLLTSDGSVLRLQQYSRFLLALKFFEVGQLTILPAWLSNAAQPEAGAT